MRITRNSYNTTKTKAKIIMGTYRKIKEINQYIKGDSDLINIVIKTEFEGELGRKYATLICMPETTMRSQYGEK